MIKNKKLIAVVAITIVICLSACKLDISANRVKASSGISSIIITEIEVETFTENRGFPLKYNRNWVITCQQHGNPKLKKSIRLDRENNGYLWYFTYLNDEKDLDTSWHRFNKYALSPVTFKAETWYYITHSPYKNKDRYYVYFDERMKLKVLQKGGAW